MRILLLDRDTPETRFSGRLYTPFGQRDGVFTALERLRLAHPAASFAYAHPDPAREAHGAAMLEVAAARAQTGKGAAATLDDLRAGFDHVEESTALGAPSLIANLAARIASDHRLLLAAGWPLADTASLTVVGNRSDLMVHASAEILPGVVIDTRDGPVIIGEGAKISPFSYLKGPLAIGEGAWVDNCRLNGPVVIGRFSRVGGEVEASLIGDYSNKHHEGFLGHSVVGRWVNIGALATTSDLKNNYGIVKLSVPEAPFGISATQELATGRQKFGSIIADCVKIGIMLPLSTGSVIDFGANLFRTAPARFTPSFAWGDASATYDIERFLADCATIFARRKQVVSPAFVASVRDLWERRGTTSPA
jgi:glucose-1-phosphate thymidylyltransferase